MALTLAQCQNFIRSQPDLRVPTAKLPKQTQNSQYQTSTLPHDNTPEGYVVETSFISFADNLLGQQKADVMNSFLYAQRQADATPDKWDDVFRTTLQSCAWTVNNPIDRQPVPYQTLGRTSPIYRTVQKQLLSILTPVQYELSFSTIDSIKLAVNASADAVLNAATVQIVAQATNDSPETFTARFMGGVCYSTPTNNVIFDICFFSYDFTAVNMLFGFEDCISNFQSGSQTIELNESTYDGIRTEILDKIEGQESYVASISIANPTPDSIIPPSEEYLKLLRNWVQVHVKDGNVSQLGPALNGTFPFDIVLFGVLELKGTIDITTLAFHLEVYLIIPIWGRVSIGEIDGSLKDGITLEIGVKGIATGSLHFYLKNKWDLYVDIELDTIVGKWIDTVFLFTIPH
jgi:hypothetical protein